MVTSPHEDRGKPVESVHCAGAIDPGAAGLTLDKLTGKVAWNNGPGRPGYSSPVPFQTRAHSGYLFLSGHEPVAAAVGQLRQLPRDVYMRATPSVTWFAWT